MPPRVETASGWGSAICKGAPQSQLTYSCIITLEPLRPAQKHYSSQEEWHSCCSHCLTPTLSHKIKFIFLFVNVSNVQTFFKLVVWPRNWDIENKRSSHILALSHLYSLSNAFKTWRLKLNLIIWSWIVWTAAVSLTGLWNNETSVSPCSRVTKCLLIKISVSHYV